MPTFPPSLFINYFATSTLLVEIPTEMSPPLVFVIPANRAWLAASITKPECAEIKKARN
jgi:hypothetical protein